MSVLDTLSSFTTTKQDIYSSGELSASASIRSSALATIGSL